jgi:hypothetical protein
LDAIVGNLETDRAFRGFTEGFFGVHKDIYSMGQEYYFYSKFTPIFAPN